MTKEQYLELRSGLLALSDKLDKLYGQEGNETALSEWNKWTITPDKDVADGGYIPYSKDLELLTQGGSVVEGYVCFDNPPHTRVQYLSEGVWQFGRQDSFQAWRYKK